MSFIRKVVNYFIALLFLPLDIILFTVFLPVVVILFLEVVAIFAIFEVFIERLKR